MSTNADSDPLETLFGDEADRPDEIELEDATVDTKLFHERLTQLAQAAESLETLATDLRALQRSGLTDEDVVDLLYGRNASLTKESIRTTLETTDEIIQALEGEKRVRKRELLIGLLYDQTDLGKRETESVVEELEALVERYGYDDLRNGGDSE
ncbi:hypothetical protein [Natronosalvus amylolyticus]|uniref:hypothetical protein n=1 Tax=Natronosalvus amylolyticus TaxID=2961994 RepID=UPI0020C97B28|nr:hypothetical protein [Natronosalvus amylolyticus]